MLPLLARELRLRARQKGTYWTRCGVSAVAAIVAVQEMVSSSAGNPAAIGKATFSAVAWFGFLVACGSALVTADSICRERREGTLGLLLLTRLRAYHVVFGKLGASGLTAAFGLIGFLPALAIVVLAGGVGGSEVARTALALLNCAFVCLTVGLWVSSKAGNRSNAMRGAIFWVFLLCSLPRIIMNAGMVFSYKLAGLGCFSPYTPFALGPDASYLGARRLYWFSLGVTHFEGWLLLAFTTFRIMRTWRSAEQRQRTRRVAWEPVVESEAKALAESRVDLMNEDPVCWAVGRMRIQMVLIWAGTLLLLLGGTGLTWGALMAGTRGGTAMGLWDSLHLLVSLSAAALLAWAAGRFLYEGQRSGELELLLSTPLGAKDIIGGNWRALCKPLRGAWLLVAGLVMLEVLAGPGSSARGPAPYPEIFQRIMAPLIRVLDIVALCWMGMWFGLKIRKPSILIGSTVSLVVGLPWLISFIFMIGLSLNSGTGWGGGTNQPSLLLLFWFIVWPILNLAKDVFFIQWASRHLRSELRTHAGLAVPDLVR